MSAPPRRHLAALTGIRFFAALHVVVFHCTGWARGGWPDFARNVASTGFVAVSLFFVLSGFILTYTHSDGVARRDFYANRFARIYPVYAFGLLLSLPFFVIGHVRAHTYGRLIEEGGAVAGLVQAYFPSLAMAWNPPAWSLSAEATFYFFFPILAPHLLRIARGGAVAIGLGAWALSVAAPLAYMAIAPDGVAVATLDTVAFWIDILKYHPLVRITDFVVGIVLGRLYLDGVGRGAIARHAPWLAPATVLALLAALAGSPAIPYPLLHNGLLTPLFALLIYTLAADTGPLAKLLATRPMQTLGEASYALYILHIPVVILARKALGPIPGFTYVYFTLVIGASIASYRFIETPMRRRVRRWLT